MRLKATMIILFGAALAGSGAASAQQANPLDNVPDAMPADIPYGAPISLDRANAALAAAVAESKKRNWKLNIAVVDSGGSLVAFQRMDGAQLPSRSRSTRPRRLRPSVARPRRSRTRSSSAT